MQKEVRFKAQKIEIFSNKNSFLSNSFDKLVFTIGKDGIRDFFTQGDSVVVLYDNQDYERFQGVTSRIGGVWEEKELTPIAPTNIHIPKIKKFT